MVPSNDEIERAGNFDSLFPVSAEERANIEAHARRRVPNNQRLNQVADEEWHKYSHDRSGKPRFDAAGSQAWFKTYNEKFEAFDQEFIAPLAEAHVAWMKQPCMSNHMACNYDTKNMESGVAYTTIVGQLLKHTDDKQPSYDLYVSWLKEKEFKPENLVMRALGLNQENYIAAIKNADAAVVDGRAFPSDAVMGATAAALGEMAETAQKALGILMGGLSGPALRYWNDFHAGVVGSGAAAAMATASGRQILRVPVVGTTAEFIEKYLDEIYRLDPHLEVSRKDLGKAIAAQRKLLEIEGVPMNNQQQRGWYITLDKATVTNAGATDLKKKALANRLKQAMIHPSELKELEEANGSLIRSTKGVAVGATIVGGILMMLNYSKLMGDVTNGMSHEKSEAVMRLRAGTFAIAGFATEQIGVGLEGLGEIRLRNMTGRWSSVVPTVLKTAGRYVGLGAGLFLGGMDIWKGWSESSKGDPSGLANFYFATGFIGGILASTLFAVSMGWVVLGPIGWLFVGLAFLALMLITLYVETSKDNKLQEWLSRCHFGLGSDKYADDKMQLSEYELALK